MTENLKMVLLGQSSTGKTSIVYRLLNHTFSDITESTIGASFVVLHYGDIKFQVWDTAGQERYHSLIPMYYRDSSLVLIVYDINDTESICKVEYYLEKISPGLTKDAHILIVGNKLDIVDELAVYHATELVKSYASKFPMLKKKIQYINISAKTGEYFDRLTQILQNIGEIIVDIKKGNPINIDNMIKLELDKNYFDDCKC